MRILRQTTADRRHSASRKALTGLLATAAAFCGRVARAAVGQRRKAEAPKAAQFLSRSKVFSLPAQFQRVCRVVALNAEQTERAYVYHTRAKASVDASELAFRRLVADLDAVMPRMELRSLEAAPVVRPTRPPVAIAA